ncbi:MAG: Spy/CpxP family protein refolding chaperone [Tepidisphaeraceae bacterium]|jgi:Spy/CpxP family protein refolding chaperone
MWRSKIILTAMVILVMAAGVTVGRLSMTFAQTANTSTQGPKDNHRLPWWARLNLSSEQQQQVDAIWKSTRPQMEMVTENRRNLDKERDVAIRGLFTPDQATAYDKILSDYHSDVAASDKQQQAILEDANARTRALLDEEQQKKWDAMVKEQKDHWRHGSGGSRMGTRASTNASTTQP